MRIILILILIGLFIILSRALSKYFIDRNSFFENLKNFLDDFYRNLGFRKNKISVFLNEKKYKNENFNKLLQEYNSFLNKDKKMQISNIKILKDDEILLLENMFSFIGKNDTQNEQNQIENYISEIENILKNTRDEKRRYVPLILKLGLLLGILIGILFI